MPVDVVGSVLSLEAIMSKPFQFSLAPDKLWQSINPWTVYQQGAQFGVVNIDIGQTPQPEVEQDILEKVGSYGRQLGHIGEAFEVLLNHIDVTKLKQSERDILEVFRGDLACIRQVKQEAELDRSNDTDDLP
jgi:hypothetical protein